MRKIIKIFIDLDGTICGDAHYTGWISSGRALFKTGILNDFIPPSHSWKVLTARPRIDKFLINRALRKYKLFPDEIILIPTWFYNFENSEEAADWKSSILSKEIDNIFVDKVIYVDSDADVLSKIINNKDIILCKPNILKDVLKELEE